PARLGSDLHQGHVRRIVHEHGRFADLAHAPRQPGPVVIGELSRTEHVQRNPRLGRQQSRNDLDLAHLQREEGAGHVVSDGRRPGEVHRDRGVVRRYHAPAGQEKVIAAVDTYAAHRHTGYPVSVHNGARLWSGWRAEPYDVRPAAWAAGEDTPVAEAHDQLA